MARSQFPCLGMGVCLPLVCWIEPYFVGPAGLPVKSTAEPFQLPAQLSVGHAATVKLPLPVLLVGIAVNAPETVLLLPPQRPFGGVETGSSMARWRLSGMLLCCVASAAGLPAWRPTRGLARKSFTGIPRRAGTSETGTEELLSSEPLELLPWEPGGEPWKPSCDMPAGTLDTDPLGVFGKP